VVHPDSLKSAGTRIYTPAVEMRIATAPRVTPVRLARIIDPAETGKLFQKLENSVPFSFMHAENDSIAAVHSPSDMSDEQLRMRGRASTSLAPKLE